MNGYEEAKDLCWKPIREHKLSIDESEYIANTRQFTQDTQKITGKG